MKIPNQAIFKISVVVHNLSVCDIIPNNYPEVGEQVFNENGDKVTYRGDGHWIQYSEYYEEYVEAEPPKLWYDIPKFDIERTELEKLSKEELINMILNKPGYVSCVSDKGFGKLAEEK